MSNHSRLWKTRQSSLGKKESELRNELESVSSIFEGQAKKILIGVAVIGIVAFTISKVSSSSKKKEEIVEKPKKREDDAKKHKTVVKSSFSIKNILAEKITMALLSFILTQIAEAIKNAKTKDKGTEEED